MASSSESKYLTKALKRPDRTHMLVCCCGPCARYEFDVMMQSKELGLRFSRVDRTVRFDMGGMLIVRIVNCQQDINSLLGYELASWDHCGNVNTFGKPLLADLIDVLNSRVR